MADGAVPQQYWNALLGMTTRATADYNDSNPSQSQPSVDPGPLSDEVRLSLYSGDIQI